MLIGLGLLLVPIIMVGTLGCRALYPTKVRIDQRLDQFAVIKGSVSAPVKIYWNENAIPFIEASSDADLAFVLGAVHAHLRLGQMEFLKRIATGRISEMAGPFTENIDYAIRILDLGKIVAEQQRNLPTETLSWLENFVSGINSYQQQTNSQPPEFGLLGIDFEPWTVRDVLTIGRLAGSDVSWFSYFRLLNLRKTNKNFRSVWKAMLRAADRNFPSFGELTADQQDFKNLLELAGKHGSNSVVISGEKSSSGSAMIASDPHLGLGLPNFWLIAGVRSPSYHCVGLMIPGFPIFGLGRNAHLAWGGTNMRAAASELVALDNYSVATAHTRTEEINRRFLWPSSRTIRDSRFGPIISDSSLIPTLPGEHLALLWTGHSVSDEVSAFLKAARAETVDEFRQAFETFAVSPQNLLIAHHNGEIGQLMAGFIPKRGGFYNNDLVVPEAQLNTEWKNYYSSQNLPYVIQDNGFLVSANNRPTNSAVPISFNFSSPDRARRLRALVERKTKLNLADLQDLQFDVYSAFADETNRSLLALIKARLPDTAKKFKALLAELSTWNGEYQIDSRAALQFEIFLAELITQAYQEVNGDLPDQYADPAFIRDNVIKDLQKKNELELTKIFEAALEKSLNMGNTYQTWGAIHRLRVGHQLSAIPLLGRFFRLADLPAAGSRETVLKTAHDLVRDRHYARYGAQSRHISDLSNLDENYFILLGGQDGWLGSENFADQLSDWQTKNYIRVPMQLETVRQEFKLVSTIAP